MNLFLQAFLHVIETFGLSQTLKAFCISNDELLIFQVIDFDSFRQSKGGLVKALPDCEEIQGASGPFGECETNPIPVNGQIGANVYLSNLRSRTGVCFFWHCLGSAQSSIYPYPIDVYELVAADATEWRKLYFGMYHRRRSQKVPEGLSLTPWKMKNSTPKASELLHTLLKAGQNGRNQFVENFPVGLSAAAGRYQVPTGEHLLKTKSDLYDFIMHSSGPSINGDLAKWERPAHLSNMSKDRLIHVEKSDGMSLLTLEAISEWLVGQHRDFYALLLKSAQAETEGLPALVLTPDMMTSISCNAYAIQVAIVALTYNQYVDDSRFLTGGHKGGIDILPLLEKIQVQANETCKRYAKVDSPDFDPFPVAGCLMNIKDLSPKILLYYGGLFTGIEPLARAEPEAVRFAKSLAEKMKTTNPLVGPMALAYFFAYRELLTQGGRMPYPDMNAPDIYLANIILRTWGAWNESLVTFQKRLLAFADSRSPAFT